MVLQEVYLEAPYWEDLIYGVEQLDALILYRIFNDINMCWILVVKLHMVHYNYHYVILEQIMIQCCI
jgi:hypothetical protein